MNILFVCSANKDRSKTADDYFSEHFPLHNFDSAGTHKKICNQLGTNYIEKVQIGWADKIFVMEGKHRKAIQEITNNRIPNKITVLMIKDIYKYGDKELIAILTNKIIF